MNPEASVPSAPRPKYCRPHLQATHAAANPQDRRIHFFELPWDILLLVFSLVHPRSLIYIRRTCAAFNALAREPWVWKAVAKRIISQNDMIIPQHILDAMMQDEKSGRVRTDLLERFATTPNRVMSAMRSKFIEADENREFPGFPKPTLWPREQVKYREFADFRIRGARLLPGGKYMLVEDQRTVTVVTLEGGGPSEGEVTPRIIAMLRCDANAPQSGSNGRVADWGLVNGSTLRLVLAKSLVEKSSEINMYDIDLNSSSSTFVLVASKRLTEHLHAPENCAVLLGTRVVLVGSTYALVWDFVSNECIRWQHGQGYHAKMRIYTFGDSIAIISCDAKSTTVFSPPLPRPFSSNTHDQLEPWFTLSVPGALIYHPRRTPADQQFLIFWHRPKPRGALPGSLYAFTLEAGRQPMRFERPRIRMQSTEGHGLRAYKYAGPYSMVPCDGGWVFADVLQGENAVMQYTWPGHGRGQEGTLTLGYSRKSKTDMRSFDPTSGRMCVIRENGTLIVVDYV